MAPNTHHLFDNSKIVPAPLHQQKRKAESVPRSFKKKAVSSSSSSPEYYKKAASIFSSVQTMIKAQPLKSVFADFYNVLEVSDYKVEVEGQTIHVSLLNSIPF
jgi:hypothetical protein